MLEQDVEFETEIVIGEDHSTDSTAAILREYQARHPDKIRLFERETNLGAIANFWSTLDVCCGQYVALLEGDDYWTDRRKLSRQVEFLDAHPDHAICFHNVRGTVMDGSEPDFDYCPADQKPSMTFHEHHNPGSQPMMWLDVLDLPVVAALDAVVYEDGPAEETDLRMAARSDSEHRYGGGCLHA